MGVKACDRYCCENIMCDRIILGEYYICDDCWIALLKIKETWGDDVKVEDVRDLIKEFMGGDQASRSFTEKHCQELDAEFKKLFANSPIKRTKLKGLKRNAGFVLRKMVSQYINFIFKLNNSVLQNGGF